MLILKWFQIWHRYLLRFTNITEYHFEWRHSYFAIEIDDLAHITDTSIIAVIVLELIRLPFNRLCMTSRHQGLELLLEWSQSAQHHYQLYSIKSIDPPTLLILMNIIERKVSRKFIKQRRNFDLNLKPTRFSSNGQVKWRSNRPLEIFSNEWKVNHISTLSQSTVKQEGIKSSIYIIQKRFLTDDCIQKPRKNGIFFPICSWVKIMHDWSLIRDKKFFIYRSTWSCLQLTQACVEAREIHFYIGRWQSMQQWCEESE